MSLNPTLSNAQGQLDPESTGITVDYFLRDQRWLNARIAPVFPTRKRRARLTRWAAEDALPKDGARLIVASGGTGAELPTQAKTPVEFFVNGGQLTSIVPDQEVDDATDEGNPEEPFQIRAILAAGYLQLEMESRVQGYFTPTDDLFPADNIIAPSGNWKDYNPVTDRVIGPDIKGLVAAFETQYRRKPNFAKIGRTTDTFFMDQLLKERNTSINLGSFTQSGDILPSSDGRIVADMEILVPNALKESTPLDAAYSPGLVWGDSRYFVVGYSPTLAGQVWNKVGDVYVAQADYQRPGIVPFAVMRQRDPVEKNKRTFMWWEFERSVIEVKADMVMAVGPIWS